MPNTAGDDEPRAAAGDGLPGWASRHLAEAGAVVTPAAPVAGRHRTSRRREPSRLRGWALATAAVAAATGTVPLALSTLAREEAPMPRVGTFPVVAPADLGPGAVRAGSDATPGPDLAATLPPMTTGDEPVVAPTAQSRPLPAAPRATVRSAPREATRAAQAPRRSTPAATPPAETTTTTPRPTSSAPADPDDDRTDEPDPRDGPSTTTTTTRTTPSDEERDGGRDDAPRRSVIDSTVGTVGDLGGRLLG